MFSLIQMLGRSAPIIDVVDVGAMWLGAAEVAYRGLLKPGLCRVVGFEPVQAECDKLNAMNMAGQRYLPYFIGDGSERTFVLTNASMTASLYEPNTRLIRRFNQLESVMQPVQRSPVKTTRLDDVGEITACDFLKIDVQGADLDVLKGAERLLEGVLFVHCEANFLPLYEGCPLFADLDAHLRSKGFFFHTFGSIQGRAFKPLVPDGDVNRPVRQMLWADAVWVRSFLDFSSLSPEALLKLAVIAHEAYGSVDLAGLALQHREAKQPEGLWSAYMGRLLGGQAPKAPPLDAD